MEYDAAPRQRGSAVTMSDATEPAATLPVNHNGTARSGFVAVAQRWTWRAHTHTHARIRT